MHKRKPWLRLLICFFVGASFASVAWAQDPHIILLEKSTRPLHLYVQFGSHPDREAVISWATTLPGKNHVLYYDTTARNGNTTLYANRSRKIHSGAYTLQSDEKPMASYYHHAYLGDLKPSTRYYITVESDGERLGEYSFITAPADDRPVTLFIGGDSRLGADRVEDNNARRRMNTVMRQLFEKNPGIIALAHTADYTNRAYWSQLYYWLKDHFEKTTTADKRLLPIFPSRGNHDMDIGFEEMFWWPDRQNDFYYTANLNRHTALVILNTEISLNGNQRDWLEKELQALRPKKRWLGAMYHRPAYPSVRAYEDGESRRRAWVPLFERYKLDLISSGHDHSMKRTVPILAVKANPEGIVYIGDGGLGVRPREVDPSRWYLKPPGIAKSVHNVHMVEYGAKQITIEAFGIEGETLDYFVIPADRRARVKHYQDMLNGTKGD
ncbi:metallophosphoesterase family protein [Parapedobacter sp. 10938]|uniref:metallophosphoesterase family protein n=1 Tax=Parapedobacter flavus TaxID=3110225 RepID=UPI002DB7CD69|nr:metallophosphoesterase family protein [Parapedobacter sp. 10938]MEC3879183.1 metallophosphoesterase family protein [Parapedobacter sp. 10938]